MNRALLNRRLRKLHLWFAVAIGAQIGLWLISGLFMTLFPIEQVRGDNLKTEITAPALSYSESYLPPAQILNAAGFPAQTLTLTSIQGAPVWLLIGQEDSALIDAKTARSLSPLSQSLAIQIAKQAYVGSGEIALATFYETPPHEYGRAGPVWRIDFQKPQPASFYVDASTGELKAVRTRLWRAFDFMWGLHIMDWKDRENFNSWWIKMTASLAVIFFLTGLGLALQRVVSLIVKRKS